MTTASGDLAEPPCGSGSGNYQRRPFFWRCRRSISRSIAARRKAVLTSFFFQHGCDARQRPGRQLRHNPFWPTQFSPHAGPNSNIRSRCHHFVCPYCLTVTYARSFLVVALSCGCDKKFHRRPLRRSAIGGGRYFLSELTGTVTPSLFAPQRTTTTSASIGSRKMRTTIPRSPVARSWTRVPTGYLGLLSIAAPAAGRRVSLLHGGSRLPDRSHLLVRASMR
jgi:hypothetical protein